MRWWMWALLGLVAAVLLLGGAVAVSSDSSLVKRLARAIAAAEGFYVLGSRPSRNNNPGNLTRDTTGKGTGTDSGLFVIYANWADGWEALEKQVRSMLNGTSRIYDPSMTIAQVAGKYTATDQADWARNVAVALGVTTETRLDRLA